jgi:type IV secretion system protein VirB8
MSDLSNERLGAYYEAAESWSIDRQKTADKSRRLAWIAAGSAAAIAFFEAIALVLLVPLKRDVPYTLLVDRQTGFVQAIRPLQEEAISADSALTRSFLVQYVIARESFDAATLQENYRKTGLWSADEARERYLSLMRSSNPLSPLASLPRGATIDVDIRSVSSLAADRALVRFSTTRTDPGTGVQTAQHWAAVITYRYTNADMTAEDRLLNPLGFQVIRYRRDPETSPVDEAFMQTPPVRLRQTDPGGSTDVAP